MANNRALSGPSMELELVENIAEDINNKRWEQKVM